MPLLSPKEVLNLKLSCIPLPHLKILAQNSEITEHGSAAEVIKKVLESPLEEKVEEKVIDEFIKRKYKERLQKKKVDYF